MNSEYIKIIANNKKARHNYLIESEYEAGIMLVGSEVKSIREGRVSFHDSYADIRNGEIFLRQLHISLYKYAYYTNHDPEGNMKKVIVIALSLIAVFVVSGATPVAAVDCFSDVNCDTAIGGFTIDSDHVVRTKLVL